MKKNKFIKYTLLIFSILSCHSVSFSQVNLSEKTIIHIDNINNRTPEIELVEPLILRGETKVLETDVLKVLGKLKNGNGKLKIVVNNIPATIYGDSLFFADLALVPGPNPLKIDILSGNDVVNRYNFGIYRSVKQAIVPAPAVGNGKYYALIVGINDYSDPLFNNLDYCIRDAELFYNAITSKYIFEKENVTLLKNATMEQMVESLDDFSKKVKPEDNFLIFYAGHGQWDNSSETGFWLPSDARKNSKFAWFRNSTLRDYLKEIHSKHTLLISDACFAGSIFKSRAAFTDAPLAINKLYDLPSRKAMTSGTMTEVPDQSAFIKYLVDRLNNNTEKYLSSEQLYSSFRIAVINNSSVVPQFGEIKEVGDEGGDFIFILK
jgi:hypothetical protein